MELQIKYPGITMIVHRENTWDYPGITVQCDDHGDDLSSVMVHISVMVHSEFSFSDRFKETNKWPLLLQST